MIEWRMKVLKNLRKHLPKYYAAFFAQISNANPITDSRRAFDHKLERLVQRFGRRRAASVALKDDHNTSSISLSHDASGSENIPLGSII